MMWTRIPFCRMEFALFICLLVAVNYHFRGDFRGVLGSTVFFFFSFVQRNHIACDGYVSVSVIFTSIVCGNVCSAPSAACVQCVIS